MRRGEKEGCVPEPGKEGSDGGESFFDEVEQ